MLGLRLGTQQVHGLTRGMLELGGRRAPGQAALRWSPDWADGLTALGVVTDDMPFLVDSLTAALTDGGCGIDLVLHPQLCVQRTDGNLQELTELHAGQQVPAGGLAEAWICFIVDVGPTGVDQDALLTRIDAVLQEVRCAVTDWSAMSRQVREASAELAVHGPAGAVAVDVREAGELATWLAADHLTFLGSVECEVLQPDREAIADPRSARGVLRGPRSRQLLDAVGHAAFGLSAPGSAAVQVATLAVRSVVHRAVHIDVLTIGRYDLTGRLIGELRVLGLLTASAHAAAVSEIPQVRHRFTAALQALDVLPGSHTARDLERFFQTYPRSELLNLGSQPLGALAESVLRQGDPRRTRLYLRRDDGARLASAVVYLARDRYTTQVRLRIADLLTTALGGELLEYTALVGESPLARVHYLIELPRAPRVGVAEAVDGAALEQAISVATQTWSDLFAAAVLAACGHDEARARTLLRRYDGAFPPGYQDRFDPAAAVSHLRAIDELAAGGLAVSWRPAGSPGTGADGGDASPGRGADEGAGSPGLTLLRVGESVSLSRVLPILHDIGLEVRSEHPFLIQRAHTQAGAEAPAWVLDFSLSLPPGTIDEESLPERISELVRAVWEGACESDAINALVPLAGLTWQQVWRVRAYASHLRQILPAYDSAYVQEVLTTYPAFVRLLVDLTGIELDPAWPADHPAADRAAAAADCRAQAMSLLDEVASIDHDRILRCLLSSVTATTRTNAFTAACTVRAGDGPPAALCVKFDAAAHPDIPEPRPFAELWVHSPRVRGTHLRFGPVARGGLRWSDRREDVRTEVLGLVKAQTVKNSVIVPVGAKGGFVPIGLPDPAVDRERWLAGGTAAYREFVTALLSVTDTLHDGQPVAPAGVHCRDGADPYLVVAADKGTATFSDLANEIAQRRGYWLGDAFASGGSRGYDHKAMGITARGAWESVRRHFAEQGLNTQTEPFTVVGIGDMSGDVFGNGMLLSEQIRLVAAFDHRHVFIDPDPPAAAFAERRRLFDLPRSSWADYDPSLISPGGGVFARTAKSIALSERAWQVLGLPGEPAPLTVNEVVRAILTAPVDLLWNGGIGTYVKAPQESNLDVGDKANDAVRIDGGQLRARVVGEGGNLGLTQAGRVAAALAGVRLNTDALDNSAGVDTSDHEVNLKILLQPAVRGGLSEDARDALLAGMTDEVAAHVIARNYAQNVVLGAARGGADRMLSVHRRMMSWLAAAGSLDRRLAGLPDDATCEARAAAGLGLTSPELAVLLAYAKNTLRSALAAADLAADPWFAHVLAWYFPPAIVDRFGPEVAAHPLRGPLIHTIVTNWLVELGGVTFIFRACDETGAAQADVVRAATVAAQVFSLPEVWQEITALDYAVPSATQDSLHIDSRRLLDRATRWLLAEHGGALDVAALIERYQPIVGRWAPAVGAQLTDSQAQAAAARAAGWTAQGVPGDLAQRIAAGLDTFILLDLSQVSDATGEPLDTLLPLYQAITQRYSIDPLLRAISGLPRGDWWSVQARHALRADTYALIRRLTASIADATDAQQPAVARVSGWEDSNERVVHSTRRMVSQVLGLPTVDLAALSVLMRELRGLADLG